jgi:uncharacterized membrane protein
MESDCCHFQGRHLGHLSTTIAFSVQRTVYIVLGCLVFFLRSDIKNCIWQIKSNAIPTSYLGFFGCFLYYLCLYYGYSKSNAVTVLVVQYLWPILAVLLSSFILREKRTNKTKHCELHDILGSDFPFFWIEDVNNTPTLMHWSGIVRKLSDNDSLKNRIKKTITNCSISDLPKLKASMNRFFLKEI